MTPNSLLEFAQQLALQGDDPEERFISSGIGWQHYEALLAKLEDSLTYRVTYWQGVLEIVSPSRRHERSKSIIGALLEAYFQENRIRYFPLGSTTLRKEEKRGGTEPDECYCLKTDKELPDLAIEIVVSSGGVNKLDIYQALGVAEVWVWKNEEFEVYRLQGKDYTRLSNSILLPQLDLGLLSEYAKRADVLEAVLEFREQIRQDLSR